MPPAGVATTWFEGRESRNGRATAYLCRGTLCSLPVHEASELVADLLPGA